jgi:hypothetical protein
MFKAGKNKGKKGLYQANKAHADYSLASAIIKSSRGAMLITGIVE